ncbi:hypothetical protein D3C78_1202060 [compost metagenome]
MAFQPALFGQGRGDGFDFGGFADDQQQADFAAPEEAVAVAQVHLNRIDRSSLAITRFRGANLHGQRQIIRLLQAVSRTPQLMPQQMVAADAHHQD